jgi:hypothetical protein
MYVDTNLKSSSGGVSEQANVLLKILLIGMIFPSLWSFRVILTVTKMQGLCTSALSAYHKTYP